MEPALYDRPSVQRDGLNQILTAGQLGIGYDGRGNLTSSGASAYAYNADNLLVSAGSATLGYDPLGRLAQMVGAGVTTRFAYDGAALIAEYSGSCLPSPSAGAGGCKLC